MHAAKRRLLIVDDEPDITLTLRTILEQNGFEVVSFNDPLLALRHFKPRYYELVILDIRMPDMNGFELYRQIRRKDNRVKVCFLTAVSEFREYEQYKKETLDYMQVLCRTKKGILALCQQLVLQVYQASDENQTTTPDFQILAAKILGKQTPLLLICLHYLDELQHMSKLSAIQYHVLLKKFC